MSYAQKKLYDRLVDRHSDLKKIRQPWERPCDEIIDIFRPDIVRFERQKDNEIELLGKHTYEGTPAWSARLMSEGWQGYLVSRSIDWVQHAMDEFKGNDEVNEWLQDFDEYMYSVYKDSTLYDNLGSYCRHGVTIGSPIMIIEENERTGRIHNHVPHPAERFLDQNAFGECDTLHLERERTAKNIYELYAESKRYTGENGTTVSKGNKAFSDSLKHAYESGAFDQKFTIIRCFHYFLDPIFEGLTGDERPTAPWMCYTLELNNNKKKVCKVERYWSKPFVHWPYEKDPSEVYARTPAWYCYYDSLSLQDAREGILMAGKLVNRPPMWIPGFMKKTIELYPEGLNYYPNEAQAKMRPEPILAAHGNSYPVGTDMEDRIKDSVERWFHVKFFLMLSQWSMQQKAPPTAYHIMQMMGERAVLLAPRIGNFTRRLEEIDTRMVDIEDRAQRLPQPPDIVLEQSGGKLRPEFIGPLAQVQQQYHETRRMENTMMQINPFLSLDPLAAKKIRAEVAVEHILEKNRFLQDAIVSEDEYRQIISAVAQQQQLQEGVEVGKDIADAVPKVSKKIEEGSPLALMTGAA